MIQQSEESYIGIVGKNNIILNDKFIYNES